METNAQEQKEKFNKVFVEAIRNVNRWGGAAIYQNAEGEFCILPACLHYATSGSYATIGIIYNSYEILGNFEPEDLTDEQIIDAMDSLGYFSEICKPKLDD